MIWTHTEFEVAAFLFLYVPKRLAFVFLNERVQINNPLRGVDDSCSTALQEGNLTLASFFYDCFKDESYMHFDCITLHIYEYQTIYVLLSINILYVYLSISLIPPSINISHALWCESTVRSIVPLRELWSLVNLDVDIYVCRNLKQSVTYARSWIWLT